MKLSGSKSSSEARRYVNDPMLGRSSLTGDDGCECIIESSLDIELRDSREKLLALAKMARRSSPPRP